MVKQRFSAQFITSEAQIAAIKESPHEWSGLVEYGVVTGNNLDMVVQQAKALNDICHDECYRVRLEVFHEKYRRWEEVEEYDAFDYPALRLSGGCQEMQIQTPTR